MLLRDDRIFVAFGGDKEGLHSIEDLEASMGRPFRLTTPRRDVLHVADLDVLGD
jgi:hypothetical protein